MNAAQIIMEQVSQPQNEFMLFLEAISECILERSTDRGLHVTYCFKDCSAILAVIPDDGIASFGVR